MKTNKFNDKEFANKSNQLFHLYVYPHRNLIYKLCIDYSNTKQNIQSNYNDVLTNFYNYIHTYNPKKKLQTWLHYVTKMHVFNLNKDERTKNPELTEDISIEDISGEDISNTVESHKLSYTHLSMDNYRDLLPDDILEALDELTPCLREAFLLQLCGYQLDEIMDIQYDNGSLKNKNIETVKSRVHIARLKLKEYLSKKRIEEELN